MAKPLVAIVTGSDSDLPTMTSAASVLKDFGIPFEITVSSAHRSPKRTVDLIERYHKEGIKVIIVAAGLAAHLGGVVAAYFPLPVIGVPLKAGALSGVDSLYSTVQMPPGVPVATVGIDNAQNAGLLAVQILAVGNEVLEKKLIDYKKKQADKVTEKAEKLEQLKYKKYSEMISKSRGGGDK